MGQRPKKLELRAPRNSKLKIPAKEKYVDGEKLKKYKIWIQPLRQRRVSPMSHKDGDQTATTTRAWRPIVLGEWTIDPPMGGQGRRCPFFPVQVTLSEPRNTTSRWSASSAGHPLNSNGSNQTGMDNF